MSRMDRASWAISAAWTDSALTFHSLASASAGAARPTASHTLWRSSVTSGDSLASGPSPIVRVSASSEWLP